MVEKYFGKEYRKNRKIYLYRLIINLIRLGSIWHIMTNNWNIDLNNF